MFCLLLYHVTVVGDLSRRTDSTRVFLPQHAADERVASRVSPQDGLDHQD